MSAHVWTATVIEEPPLAERIGPYVFWAVLVALILVIVWAYARQLRGRRPSQEAGTRPRDYARHHRVVWSVEPSAAAPSPRHHPLGVTAVYGICGGSAWDVLRLDDTEPARAGLAEAWGVTSRPDLLHTILWLLREGHRVGFADDVARGSGLTPQEGRRLRRWLRGSRPGSAAAEQAWRLRQVHADARGIRGIRFEAWDLVRAAMLTRAGFSLGWLSEDEAVDTLDLISTELRRDYASWEEMGEHFLTARWYWAAERRREGRATDAHDASRQAALLDPQRGPWAFVPWDAPVPRSRLLLVNALVDEGVLDAVPRGTPTPLARTVDRAIGARLTATP